MGGSSIARTHCLEERLVRIYVRTCATTSEERLTWALGARRFNSIATVAKSNICTEAPAAYQSGPDTPYRKATLVDCRRVAAQVHEETTALATRPDLTVRPAVENISDVCSSWLYRLSAHVVKTWNAVNGLLTVVFIQGLYHADGE
jgi:hypothetical protein